MSLKSSTKMFILLFVLLAPLAISTGNSLDEEKLKRTLNMNKSKTVSESKAKKATDSGLTHKVALKKATKSKRKLRREKLKRLDRHLLMEKHENPGHDNLFSGKLGLDKEYQNLIDDQAQMQKKIKKNQASLYKEYHDFEARKKSMKRKRDRKLKDLLASSTVDNFFHETGDVPKKSTDKILEVSDSGLVVKDEVTEKKERMLMGMKDLDDLGNLDISRELEHRHRKFRRERKADFDEEKKAQPSFNIPRELMDEDASAGGDQAKKVKSVSRQSFFVRKNNKDPSTSYFKSERQLRGTSRRFLRGRSSRGRSRRRRPSRRRTSNRRRPTRRSRRRKPAKRKLKRKSKRKPKRGNTRTKIVKKLKYKKLKKIYKKKHKFNWKTLRWEHVTKYRFQLLHSVKDIKFWDSLGFKIKKSKLKLMDRWQVARKKKESQMQCVLTAKISPMKTFKDVDQVVLRVIFSSNCMKYPVARIFVSRFNGKSVFRINIGPVNFTIDFYKKRRNITTALMFHENVKVFPEYKTKKYDPYMDKKLLFAAGLIPPAGLKWRFRRFQVFTKYQRTYPTRTYHQALIYKEMLRRKRHALRMKRLRMMNMPLPPPRRRRPPPRRRRKKKSKKRKSKKKSRKKKRKPKKKKKGRKSSKRRSSRRRRGRRRRRRRRRRRGRRLQQIDQKDEQTQKMSKEENSPTGNQERQLKQKEVIKESDFAREPESTDQAPPLEQKERELRDKDRKLRWRRRRRRNHHHHHRRHHHHHHHRRRPLTIHQKRMKDPNYLMLMKGYKNVNQRKDWILSRTPYNPSLAYSIIKAIWDTSDRIVTCNASHVHLCNV